MPDPAESLNCRLCLKECKDALPIFTCNEEHSLLEMISKYLYLKIEPDDIYSTNICQECMNSLMDFHNFYQCILECQFTLKALQVTAQTTIELKKQVLTQTTERDQDYLENEESEDCMVVNEAEAADVEQNVEGQATPRDQLFSDASKFQIKFLSEDNVQFDDNKFTEDAGATNDCIEIMSSSSGESLDSYSNEKNFEETLVESSKDLFANTKIYPTKIHKTYERLGNLPVGDDIQDRTCSICFKVYSCIPSLRRHKQVHDKTQADVKQRTCNKCFRVYSTIFNMKEHFRRSHRVEDVENRTCLICNKLYSTVYSLKQHIYINHKKGHEAVQHRTCPVCRKVFPTVRKTKFHIARFHRKESVEDRTCSLCAKVCNKMSSLRTHLFKAHNNAKPFACNFCNYSCVVRSALKAHSKYCYGTIANGMQDNIEKN